MPPKAPVEEEEEVEEEQGPPPLEEGEGKYVFPDGSWFQGTWQKGGEIGENLRRHGKGVHVDGDQSYDGDWFENKYHGSGKYTWPSGACYEGEWLENRMHGKGVDVDAQGVSWSGRFYNGAGPGLNEAV